ncbi:hypothetical protein BsIDN1_61270 [Bacillus safensis]|uniref:Uncharacterized protein n=1 Tax=Bacillus safensis TaxID=561879 RepID=A0A5S9MKU5_BACIA|nr:hypothetical protein BsIDN1_61270 [Bacillus safensis]
MVEDTLIFIPLGIPVWPLLVIRLISAILLTAAISYIWRKRELAAVRKGSHMNESTINTVLFDLDGTLINTNELIIASFQHTLDHYYPGQYSREDILHFIGPSVLV